MPLSECSQPPSLISLTSSPSKISVGQKEFKSQISLKVSSMISSCRICLSSVFDPAYLSCGHKFCENCLDRYWQIGEKPSYLVCPLCRALAYDIDFTKKEESEQTGEFRKNFNMSENIEAVEVSQPTFLCVKITMLMPFLYFIVKWFKVPVTELFTIIRMKLLSKM